ncbi:cyclic GMP-AMP synthase isoform X3 [Cricetulus griseus]|uniref:Cyclic GMP-AMP synthase isoform X3 n=1 Tax=Cricetulus griseus TaxID=10029 RepID=A0A9J7JNB0_CRIGR|nr:cyclic GMP-AMP synthase isoform X3 [Cricetulus griseus]
MEGQCRRPTASRAKKPAAKRATTEPNRTVAAPSHAGGCGPQRGARSRRAEPDGVPTEQPRAQAPGARPGRTSVRIKDLQPSATGAAGDAEQPTVPEPRPPAIPEAQPPVDPGAPDVARGPSRRRGARSVGQPGAPRGSRRKQEETPDKKLKKVLEKLRLKRKEISVAAEVVNGVVGQLLSRMQNRESEFKGLQQLNTGSYYERVKISAPNEFDVMFKLEVPRIQLQEFCDTGAFYLVKLRRISGGNPLGHFLEDEILSASKMLSKFREIIKEEVEKIKGQTWRLSFSHTEKYILNNHGIEKTCCESAGVKCCRKDILKLMKYLLEQLKKEHEELDVFCSYHVKTAIFHMWTENPQDSQWDPKHLSVCFDEFLTFFVECLRTEKLMHYFIPKFNLFSQELIDQNSKEFLWKRIEYERNNGFPIFNKF